MMVDRWGRDRLRKWLTVGMLSSLGLMMLPAIAGAHGVAADDAAPIVRQIDRGPADPPGGGVPSPD